MERNELTIGPAKNEQVQPDGRAEWERPSLRRLEANRAGHGAKTNPDGSQGTS